MLGNLHAAFGGGPGEKGWQQYLACGLSYWVVGIWGSHALAEQARRREDLEELFESARGVAGFFLQLPAGAPERGGQDLVAVDLDRRPATGHAPGGVSPP